MALLAVEALIILILVAIMVNVYVLERQRRKQAQHLVKLREFWDGKERRSTKRFDTRLDVDYSINIKPFSSKSRDISAKGIGLILNEKIEKGTPIRIQIKLPAVKSAIEVKGQIAWSAEVSDLSENEKRAFSTGIEFTYIPPKYQKVLFEYIKGLEQGQNSSDG